MKTTSTPTEAGKPDILFIMPDQMRGDCLSCLGHPAVKTPQMDQLAEEGVLFRRAYTPVASCIPARYALLTGLFSQTSGVVGFDAKVISTPTLSGMLSDAGYSTVLVGRNMHQKAESGACGYQKRILGSTYVNDDDYDSFLCQTAPETGGITNFVKNTMQLYYNLWPADAWPLADELHPTEWTVEQSRKVVQETDQRRPLFLTTSFYAPHPPLFPPEKYFDEKLAAELPEPARGDWVDSTSLPVNEKGQKKGTRVSLEGETLRRAQAGYFGLIEHIDHQISSLIRDFKDRSEQAGRPWVIVITSDHGEMLGDHGYFRKCEPYEGSANIPFIFSGSPSLGFKNGRHLNQPVSLPDIMPTLLTLAGVETPDFVDGIDLCPPLRGSSQPLREWLHFEHAPQYSDTQAFQALTDGRFKYIWRSLGGREQLFDLEKDPKEEHDLSRDADSQEVLKKWRNTLIRKLADRPEGFVKNGELVPVSEYPPLNNGELNAKNEQYQ